MQGNHWLLKNILRLTYFALLLHTWLTPLANNPLQKQQRVILVGLVSGGAGIGPGTVLMPVPSSSFGTFFHLTNLAVSTLHWHSLEAEALVWRGGAKLLSFSAVTGAFLLEASMLPLLLTSVSQV